MTTLAGHKIRKYREAQAPKQSRADFGAPFGAPAATVTGWEDFGKTPRSAAVMNALVATGVVTHADWYRPATCPSCEAIADDDGIAACRQSRCPLAAMKAA